MLQRVGPFLVEPENTELEARPESQRPGALSCLSLSDPMDCSPPGSSVRGILQATVLE